MRTTLVSYQPIEPASRAQKWETQGSVPFATKLCLIGRDRGVTASWIFLIVSGVSDKGNWRLALIARMGTLSMDMAVFRIALLGVLSV